jgi:AraC family transcriptional regulator
MHSTARSHAARLGRVVDHIHAHLDDALDLNRLAELAHLSPHHWHRVYHAMYGETLAATVKRLRLHRAAGYLAHGDWDVARVAREAGYPNLQSFTRIFKSVYGLPPARYRLQGRHAPFVQAASSAPAPALAPNGYPVSVLYLPELALTAVAHSGPYMQIGQAFDTLMRQLAPRGLIHAGSRLVGLYHDDPDSVPEAQLRSMAAVVGAPPVDTAAPLQAVQRPAGFYAVLRYQGPYASMRAAYHWLFGQWLPQSDWQAADTPLLEEYLNNPRDTPPNELLSLIYLPLAPG